MCLCIMYVCICLAPAGSRPSSPQRLVIAGAVLVERRRQTRILMLDEATSSLDARAERLTRQSLQTLIMKTLIMKALIMKALIMKASAKPSNGPHRPAP